MVCHLFQHLSDASKDHSRGGSSGHCSGLDPDQSLSQSAVHKDLLGSAGMVVLFPSYRYWEAEVKAKWGTVMWHLTTIFNHQHISTGRRWVHSDYRGYRDAELPVSIRKILTSYGEDIKTWPQAHTLSLSTSVKFINKIQYVHSLEELEQLIPMEHVQIPDCVLQWVSAGPWGTGSSEEAQDKSAV